MREGISNDVPVLPDLQKDFEEAGIEIPVLPEKVEQGPIPVPFPFPPPSDAALFSKELIEAAQAQLKETFPLVEELVKKEEVVTELQKAGVEVDFDAIGEIRRQFDEFERLRAIPARDPDLRAFKKQVIAAFKHLGLDTKQFFGV